MTRALAEEPVPAPGEQGRSDAQEAEVGIREDAHQVARDAARGRGSERFHEVVVTQGPRGRRASHTSGVRVCGVPRSTWGRPCAA